MLTMKTSNKVKIWISPNGDWWTDGEPRRVEVQPDDLEGASDSQLCNLYALSTGCLWEDEREYLVGLLTERDLAKYTAWLEEVK